MTRSHRNPPTGITTTFGGVSFRSRLEARWAVTLSLMGWTYEYEPMVKTAGPYLPDFWIESASVYAEVKPWRFGSHYEKPEWKILHEKIEAAKLDAPVIMLGATYGYRWDAGVSTNGNDSCIAESDFLTYGLGTGSVPYETEEPLGWSPGQLFWEKPRHTPIVSTPGWMAPCQLNPFLKAAWTEAGNKTRWRPRAA